MTTLVWFRNDLRLADHPALHAAMERGDTVLPLFILDETDPYPLGGASRWWLHHSLKAFQDSLEPLGLNLILRKGDPLKIIPALMKEHRTERLYLSKQYDPHAITLEKKLQETLTSLNIETEFFASFLLKEPGEIKNKEGNPFKIYTAFWNAFEASFVYSPLLPIPRKQRKSLITIPSETLDHWQLLPTHPDWASGLRSTWKPGEKEALIRLRQFIKSGLNDYKTLRDCPGQDRTSHLSPYLHSGEISIRTVYQTVYQLYNENNLDHNSCLIFLKELVWREFAYYTLYHFPEFPKESLRPEFNHFPWVYNKEILTAWQRGQTGYPIVDAGMRQLYATGWMHNRVRMIVASFLTKNLLQAWQQGSAWFWDTLVDADLANNALGWQWVAGSGIDSSPYFRIFNPITQGEKFDPKGVYIKKWVPELATLPETYIHRPFEAPITLLANLGVTLGQDYANPIVDLKETRLRALAAYQNVKEFKKIQ